MNEDIPTAGAVTMTARPRCYCLDSISFPSLRSNGRIIIHRSIGAHANIPRDFSHARNAILQTYRSRGDSLDDTRMFVVVARQIKRRFVNSQQFSIYTKELEWNVLSQMCPASRPYTRLSFYILNCAKSRDDAKIERRFEASVERSVTRTLYSRIDPGVA